MPTDTKIQWAKHTASPWYSCEHAKLPDGSDHPGCLNCYAETMARRNPATLGVWGPNGTRVVSKSFHAACRRWNKAAAKAGVRASVFPSMCDPFDDWQGLMLNSRRETLWRDEISGETFVFGGATKVDPGNVQLRYLTMADCRAELFATIDSCPNLDFMLLTKRPGNVSRMWCSHANTDGKPPSRLHRPNVQLIYSASDQASLESGCHQLWDCKPLVPVVGLSAEPLVGPLNLDEWLGLPFGGNFQNRLLDWVIVGGESGPGARPCNVAWIRDIVAQCKVAGVPVFVKQLGTRIYIDPGDRLGFSDSTYHKVSDPKGGDWDEWPEDLRVREFPRVEVAS